MLFSMDEAAFARADAARFHERATFTRMMAMDAADAAVATAQLGQQQLLLKSLAQPPPQPPAAAEPHSPHRSPERGGSSGRIAELPSPDGSRPASAGQRGAGSRPTTPTYAQAGLAGSGLSRHAEGGLSVCRPAKINSRHSSRLPTEWMSTLRSNPRPLPRPRPRPRQW